MSERLTSSIYKWRHTKTDLTEPSPQALADRAKRAALPDTRDLTGRLLGDPPPGRSALDRKLAAARGEVQWLEELDELLDQQDDQERDEA